MSKLVNIFPSVAVLLQNSGTVLRSQGGLKYWSESCKAYKNVP